MIDFSVGTEHGVVDGTTETFSGIDITFSATDDVGDGFAYFDTVGANGSLGVCSLSTNCVGSPDDNLAFGETVTLMFDQVWEISGLIFTNTVHAAVVGTNTLTIDVGSGAVEYTFAAASAAIFNTDTLTFGYGTTSPQDYYIRGLTAVPIPAAGFLLLAGLGGLAALRRRKS